METEDVGVDEVRQSLDVLDVLLVGAQLGHFEAVLRAELIGFIVEHVVVKVVIEESNNEPSILVVSYSSSVVALSSQVLESREGDLVILV
jgi:hypothetical protein